MSSPFDRPVILDIGGGTGEWSRPYRLHGGYEVIIIDPIVYPYLTASSLVSKGIAGVLANEREVRGVLLAPPCTEFAGSGARWWAGKDPALLANATGIVRDMLAVVSLINPKWWALENPVGRLARMVPELGQHRYTWQPWHFGDAETKLTCIWGDHTQPVRTVSERPKDARARVHLEPPGPYRWVRRSVTPQGFARAFFEANP